MAESVYDRISDYGSVKIQLASPNDNSGPRCGPYRTEIDVVVVPRTPTIR